MVDGFQVLRYRRVVAVIAVAFAVHHSFDVSRFHPRQQAPAYHVVVITHRNKDVESMLMHGTTYKKNVTMKHWNYLVGLPVPFNPKTLKLLARYWSAFNKPDRSIAKPYD
jgi:hypothetical protein